MKPLQLAAVALLGYLAYRFYQSTQPAGAPIYGGLLNVPQTAPTPQMTDLRYGDGIHWG